MHVQQLERLPIEKALKQPVKKELQRLAYAVQGCTY